MLRSALVALSVPTLILAANCTYESLQAITAQLVAAQTAGSLTPFASLDSSAAYTESFKTADITKGILATPLKIDLNRSIHDTTQCATFTELVVATTQPNYVIGTQMHITGDKVSKIDSLVTKKGDWLFNATGTLYWSSRENWAPIPAASQLPRATIQAAADAYCDIFNNKSVTVPWGQPCARLEGGSYTGKGAANDRCDVGIPSGVNLANRRYVIDERMGTADLFIDFGGAGGLPDSHEFRVEGGKLRYVHTITSCGGRSGGCMG